MIESGKLIYLCKPNREIITQLNGVDIPSVSYSDQAKDYNSLSFDVDRYINVDGSYVESKKHINFGVLRGVFITLKVTHPA